MKNTISRSDMFRDDMIKSLSFIKACVNGSASVLPLLDGDIISVIDSSVQFSKFTYVTDPNNLGTEIINPNFFIYNANIHLFILKQLWITMEKTLEIFFSKSCTI